MRQCRLLLLARSLAKYWPPLVENRPVQTEREETIFRGQREKVRKREQDEPRSPQAFGGGGIHTHPAAPPAQGKEYMDKTSKRKRQDKFHRSTGRQSMRNNKAAQLRWRSWRKESCYYGMLYPYPDQQSIWAWFQRSYIWSQLMHLKRVYFII